MGSKKSASKGKARGNRAINDLAPRKGLNTRGGSRAQTAEGPVTIGAKSNLTTTATSVAGGGSTKA